MPPKRKAPADTLPSEPARRKLRSDGPVTPAKPLPKTRATTRTTRRAAVAEEPNPEVLEPSEPKKKSATRETRSKAVAGPSRPTKAPSKRATKKTVTVPAEAEPTTETEATEAPKRRGKPPGVRLPVVEETDQAKPPSKKPPSAKPPSIKPPSTKPPSRTSTRATTRTTTAKAGPSKPPKTTRSRTTKKSAPTVVEEDEPEEDEGEEPAPEPVPPRSTTPARPRIIMDAVEIITPNRPRHPFTSNRNTPTHPKSSPTKPLSTLPAAVSVEPTTPSRSRVPPPTSPRKRRRHERSPSPELPSPSKRVMRSGALTTPGTTRIAKMPAHYHPCLQAQKRAIMAALMNPPEVDMDNDRDGDPPANDLAYDDLCDLLTGSIVRGEGNSCLLIGPRGSGKTRLVDRALAQVSNDISPIVIRLSGHIQRNDRLAIREIVWQLSHQTGKQITVDDEGDEDNSGVNEEEMDRQDVAFLPPPAYLPSMISTLTSQPKPVVVILDAFDEFALHGRQALLYCLLDTVQSCRVGSGLNGLAVIGVTNRVDTINLLEKRVKSRFSGRMLRTAGPRSVQDWWKLTGAILKVPLSEGEDMDGWEELWSGSVNRFLEERSVKTALHETWALVKDVRMLTKILTTPVLMLSPASPFLTRASLLNSIAEQRYPVGNSFLTSLPYPAICLLIASVHTHIEGHDTFTFERLYHLFRNQVRISIAAPVQIEGGGSIGMVKCSRQVMMGAFEHLVSVRVFIAVAAPSSMVTKEFVRYRSNVDREEVKKTVEKLGTMSLKKWFGKSQQVQN